MGGGCVNEQYCVMMSVCSESAGKAIRDGWEKRMWWQRKLSSIFAGNNALLPSYRLPQGDGHTPVALVVLGTDYYGFLYPASIRPAKAPATSISPSSN